MEENNNIFQYGSYNLEKDKLLKLMLSNVDSYLTYHDVDQNYKQKFKTILGDVARAISSDQITTDGFGNFTDLSNSLDSTDSVTSNVLNYIDTIAQSYSKKLENTTKRKSVLLEEETPEAFDFKKHGLANYFIQQIDPSFLLNITNSNNVDSALDYTISDWRNSFDSSSEALIALEKILESYTHKENLRNLDYSESFNDYNSYIEDINTLRKGLIDGSLSGEDKRLLNKLGLPGLELYFFENTSDNQTFVGVLDGLLDKVLGEQAINSNQTQSKKFDIEKFWSNLDDYKKNQMYTAAADVVSAISSFVPYYGTAVSAITGVTSTLGNLANDLFHPESNATPLEALGNGVTNLGMDVIGLVPAWGVGMKAKKIANALKGVASILSLGLSAYGLYNAKNSLEKLMKTPDDMTSEDFLHLANGLQVIMQGTAGYKAAKRHSSTEDLVELRSKRGKKVRITENLLDDIKSAKGYDALNALFKKYTGGQDLSLEFKTVKLSVKKWKTILGVPYRRKTVTKTTETGPKTKIKTVNLGILPEDERLDARFLRWINGEGWRVKPLDSEIRNKTSLNTSTSPVNSDSKGVTNTKDVINTENPINLRDSGKSGNSGDVNTPASKKTPNITPDITPEFRNQVLSDLDSFKTQKSLFSNDFAQQVADGLLEPSEAYKRIKRFLKAEGFSEQEITKWLLNNKIYKQGGVIKAQDGIKTQEGERFYGTNYTPTLYETLYDLAYNKILGELGENSYRNTSGLTEKETATETDLLDLNTYASKHRPYGSDAKSISDRINDLLKVIKDYRELYKDSTFEDFLAFYNEQIDNIYKDKRTFGYKVGKYNDDDQIRIFNNRHKSMYPSANSEGGVYGYDANFEHINGTTTLARGVDITDDDIDIKLSELDEDTRAWIGNRKLFKAKDGRYFTLNNPTGTDQLSSETEGETENKTGDEKQLGNNLQAQGIEKPEIPMVKPEKPDNPFFTLDKVLAGLDYLNTLRHNKEILKIANRANPLLYEPNEYHKTIFGDLRALSDGHRAAGIIKSKASNPLTSDGNLQTAARMDAENQANEYIIQGLKSDNESIRKTSNEAWALEKANKESRYNISMKNLENIHQSDLEKLYAEANKNRADYESGTNLIKEIRTWINNRQKEKDAKQNAVFARRLKSYVFNNPKEYIPGWGEYYNLIWNKNQKGEELTDSERVIMAQMQSILNDAYYEELYGDGLDIYSTPINKPAWKPELKNGGIITKNGITKDMVKTIIAYLKESNDNYHKDIDRSIKGLYNHIKLLRKK